MRKDPRKKLLSFADRIRKLRSAGINSAPLHHQVEEGTILSVEERIQKILGITLNIKNRNMIYFIMYDIENNKVRTHIAKFLIRKGCHRVQKSIFLANTTHEKYREIHTTVKEVQDLYENNDSIFFVPVSTDEIKAMKVIGQNIDFDLIMNNRNTMFF